MRLIDADRMKSNTPNWLLETDGRRKRMLYDELDWQPTIFETEIIRKAFERVVERLEEARKYSYKDFKDEEMEWRKGLKTAIEIIKEECGISE